MNKIKKRILMASVSAATIFASSAVFAGLDQTPSLPAPGILALVAGGVVAAIAVARRKK